MPQRSQAANHAFIPMPVVARNRSTGRLMHLLGGGPQLHVVDVVRVQRQGRRPVHPSAAPFQQG